MWKKNTVWMARQWVGKLVFDRYLIAKKCWTQSLGIKEIDGNFSLTNRSIAATRHGYVQTAIHAKKIRTMVF